jgi:hypothetical protein
MKMRNVVLILLISFMAQVIVAKPTRGLGLHFGTVSANGFSYRQFYADKGFQVTAGAISLDDDEVFFFTPSAEEYNNAPRVTLSEDGRRVNTNLGLNYLFSLASNPTGRFYVFGGASTIISRVKRISQEFYLNNANYYMVDLSKPRTTSWENRYSYYVGMGLGFELNLGRNFVWAIEMPITLNDDGDVMMYIPQSGLYYYFK